MVTWWERQELEVRSGLLHFSRTAPEGQCHKCTQYASQPPRIGAAAHRCCCGALKDPRLAPASPLASSALSGYSWQAAEQQQQQQGACVWCCEHTDVCRNRTLPRAGGRQPCSAWNAGPPRAGGELCCRLMLPRLDARPAVETSAVLRGGDLQQRVAARRYLDSRQLIPRGSPCASGTGWLRKAG